jgi:uncharacterized damage-inducible protein DinB
MPVKTAAGFDLPAALLGAFATNDRINAYLIENLAEAAWRAAPPGGKGRTVAGIVGHMHNVRLRWLKSAGHGGEMPAKLEGDTFSKSDAGKALSVSHRAMHEYLAQALAGDGRIKGFKPDVASFFGYLVAHDAHHRGQIAMLARQIGHALPQSVTYGLWEWGTR